MTTFTVSPLSPPPLPHSTSIYNINNYLCLSLILVNKEDIDIIYIFIYLKAKKDIISE